ncbi:MULTISPECIES: acyl-CoA dehydrogenase family protein [Rhizobium]|uniref:Dibenzothiophene monooxygenase n=1 Tax=Rhizobium rhododendri TaxID=2506430 RepID=A0ABY8IG91_9HYPH|nr:MULTISPECIES: acyl-CoA dehydrogenase family protein [Rhizobium]MBZ5762833.1 acyl-CoA dehydrogenase family protein [Rhizobium sp. VS19-DR96]MBZ5767555.1 acyl-CoA dehydrogenase family protein [Rhizobium sp. VS19-DR129.2]MBZ5776271.1 acyl-CoA dehydrogenase family protein [Rhizobium sp. VS19-DRK62.2]MBZ5786038.1 acyl-CoA dehydrogenase family protein [Rhizobium sp. VS19-DR121]MBZ5803651.1 acyl-CoA dehydrogenase family protein [Rhizobium sp. VS19-DR181]
MQKAPTNLPPLLGAAFPPNGIAAEYISDLLTLQTVLDDEIAPLAAETDRVGRYPTKSIAALKRSGFLKSVVPVAFGGRAMPHRVSMEAQLRIAIADSAVAQIYKVHDEIVREILTYCPADLKPRLSRAIVEDNAIIGLAVAEAGRKVDDPMTTTATPATDGGFIVHGRKIYTTGAAGADYIATWAYNAAAPGVAANPLAGMQLNLIPPTAPGITIHRDWDALGQRGTDSGTITFDNVKTDPLWNATIPGLFSPPHASLRYQVGFAAIMIGVGIAALREAAGFVASSSRPWPSAGVDNAADDPHTRKIMGELTAGLSAAYALMLMAADLLDAFERGEVSRTELAIPVYAAKAAANKAALEATSEIFTLMGTRAAGRKNGFDRHWRNARILSLHDPVSWKYAEIGRHVLTGWEPDPGLYQ